MADEGLTHEQAATLAVEYLQSRIHRSQPRVEPIAVLVAGEPGASRAFLAAATRDDMASRGGYVSVDLDRVREDLPEYVSLLRTQPNAATALSDPDAERIAGAVRDYAITQRRNVIEALPLADPDAAEQHVTRLRRDGYEVEVRVLAESLAESQLGAYQRAEQLRQLGIPSPAPPATEHQRAAASGLLHTVDRIGDLVDRLTVHTRSGDVLYDSNRNQDISATHALTQGRDLLALSPSQRAALAQGWDAIATSLQEQQALTPKRVDAERNQAQAHYLVRIDPDASRQYDSFQSALPLDRRAALANAHSEKLAAAFDGYATTAIALPPPSKLVLDRETNAVLTSHPELVGAVSTLVIAQRWIRDNLPAPSAQPAGDRIRSNIAGDLRAGLVVSPLNVQRQLEREHLTSSASVDR